MPDQTGPRTPEGKQTSAQNNRHHGLATANIIVTPAERPFFDEMEAGLRDEIQPDGPLENFAFDRLVTANWQIYRCREKEAALRAVESTEQNEANLEKVHRYYLRWEGSYNSAFRQIRLLQTDRGIQGHSDGNPPKFFGPLADIPKIEHFARRIATPVTFDDQVRKNLNTQLAIITMERQIRETGHVPVTGKLYVSAAESEHCETKSATQPQVGLGRRSLGEVGRNSPCPCGSGQKYKRCCGVNAPPILNHAA